MIDLIETPSILVASPLLQDHNFHRSVLLLIDQNDDGAMAVCVNKPSDISLVSAVVDHPQEIPSNIPTWIGGPVSNDCGLILTNQKIESNANEISSRGVTLTSSDAAMNNLIEYGKKYANHSNQEIKEKKAATSEHLYPYRFVIGYSGWDEKQLEDEIKEGSWLQLEFDMDLLFNTPWNKIWEQAMAKIHIDPSSFAPTVNTSPYLN